MKDTFIHILIVLYEVPTSPGTSNFTEVTETYRGKENSKEDLFFVQLISPGRNWAQFYITRRVLTKLLRNSLLLISTQSEGLTSSYFSLH